ncbi:unnamed protein product [Coregonus sp. 'balchen']|nr:unnamed protein product [Coregonus sp. 'balchen']
MDQIQTEDRDRADQQKEKHYLTAETRALADALVQNQAALTECQATWTEFQAALPESQNDALKRTRDEMESQSMPARHTCELWNSTSPRGKSNNRGGFVRSSVHPDISIPLLTPELDKLLTKHSKGRPDCYAVLLFQGCVTEERYHEWTQNTNWDGSHGKCGLPVNLSVHHEYCVSEVSIHE